MEQLIIFLLFVVVSIISSVIQSRKKKEEEAAQRGESPPIAPRRDAPVTQWPRKVGEWQDQLKRMLEENAPPVVRPVIVPEKREMPTARSSKPSAPAHIPTTLVPAHDIARTARRASASAHERVSKTYARVEERLRAASEHRTVHQPHATSRYAPLSPVHRLSRSRSALRDAFIASLIFSPPKSLQVGEEL